MKLVCAGRVGLAPQPLGIPPYLAVLQYTPRSVDGMNNMSAEIAAATAYNGSVKLLTVGTGTACGDPLHNRTDCSAPLRQVSSIIL